MVSARLCAKGPDAKSSSLSASSLAPSSPAQSCATRVGRRLAEEDERPPADGCRRAALEARPAQAARSGCGRGRKRDGAERWPAERCDRAPGRAALSAAATHAWWDGWTQPPSPHCRRWRGRTCARGSANGAREHSDGPSDGTHSRLADPATRRLPDSCRSCRCWQACGSEHHPRPPNTQSRRAGLRSERASHPAPGRAGHNRRAASTSTMAAVTRRGEYSQRASPATMAVLPTSGCDEAGCGPRSAEPRRLAFGERRGRTLARRSVAMIYVVTSPTFRSFLKEPTKTCVPVLGGAPTW